MMKHISSDHNTLPEQLFTDVAHLFDARKKLAERKTNYLIKHTGNDQNYNEIPQEYIDFCKAGVKVQLQVNNNPLLGEKIQQEILAPFSDGPNTGTAGFSRVGFEREISYPQSDIEQILLYGTLSDLETVWTYIDSLPAPLISRFNEYLTYKAYTPTTSYGIVYQSAIRLFRSLQNYITHTPKAKMMLGASKKNLQSILDLPNFSKLNPQEQALLLKKIQKALILPGSHKKIHACVSLYQTLLDKTTQDEKKDTQTTELLDYQKSQSLPVSKQVMHSIISFIKNQKLAFGSMLLLIAYIAFADTLNEQIEEKVLITTQLPKQKPGLTGFPDQKTYDQTFDIFEDSISNPATQRALSIKNIASIDDMIDQLDASFDTLLTQTKRLEEKWIYSNNGYLETLTKNDSIQFREYITTLKDQTRQINKVLNVRTEIDSIDSYADFLKKSQLITDGIIACVANDPSSVNQLSKYKHPIAIDRKLGTENSLHVLLHELHHSIATAHKYHSITEGTTEHSTQLAIEQILGSPVTSPTYTEEVTNAVLIQHAFDDPEIKQVNAFTGKQIIPGGKKISPEYIKQINAAANREHIQNMYDGLKNPEQKREMYDAIRYSRLKDYLNATKYTHPLLVLLVLPQDQVDRNQREILPKDSYFPEEVPYNKTLRAYGIEPRSCSSYFRKGLHQLTKSNPLLSTQGREFTIEEFQTFDLETQGWLFYALQKEYIRTPNGQKAGYNVGREKKKDDGSTTELENAYTDDTIEEAYEEMIESMDNLKTIIMHFTGIIILLSVMTSFLLLKRQSKKYKSTKKILKIANEEMILNFMPPVFIFLIGLIISIILTKNNGKEKQEEVLLSIMFTIMIIQILGNTIKQYKATNLANTNPTFQITEQSDSHTIFEQLQKHQKAITQLSSNLVSDSEKSTRIKNIADFLSNFDTNVTTPDKKFIQTMVHNLLSEHPTPQKKKTPSSPIASSQKSRSDITHRDRIHPHSYIPGTLEAIVYTPEVEFHKEKAKNKETIQGKHFIIHINLDQYKDNAIMSDYGEHPLRNGCYFMTELGKTLKGFQEIHNAHRAQFTIIAYKNGLPVHTNRIQHQKSFVEKVVTQYITTIESYEWTDIYDTPELINIAQQDIRKALPQKWEKNIFLGFPESRPKENIGETQFFRVEYYNKLFKSLYTKPHKIYRNFNEIGYSAHKKATKNKKK